MINLLISLRGCPLLEIQHLQGERAHGTKQAHSDVIKSLSVPVNLRVAVVNYVVTVTMKR
jgi:hypothetical protein